MLSSGIDIAGELDVTTQRVVACLQRAYVAALGRPLELGSREIVTSPLRELGIDSSATLSFLVEVEDEFGIEWNDDVPAETLASVDSVAKFVAHELAIA